jgi:hypothetical protein
MTFTVSTTRQPCSLPTDVTLSGPVLTLRLAALGVLLLYTRRQVLVGYALVFASFTPLRFIQTLTGRGDKLLLAQQWFGVTSRVIVATVVFLMGLAAALAVFRFIGNQHRYGVLLGTWLLPIPLLFVLLVTSRLLFGENGDVAQMPTILGLAWIVQVVDLLALLLFIAIAPRHLRKAETPLD